MINRSDAILGADRDRGQRPQPTHFDRNRRFDRFQGCISLLRSQPHPTSPG
ncbi:MAG: hypothetical protein J7641_01125 [Cyanobacteria bacterium SID2]|nr:hypothetical protein [Cyanobacteria bacterium SID2]MBP0004750.1 hypothetical protein [Cyanobacteria bacterium SBC]